MSLIRPGKYLSKNFSILFNLKSIYKFWKKYFQRFFKLRIFKGFSTLKNQVIYLIANLLIYLFSRLRTNNGYLSYFNKLEDNTVSFNYLDGNNKQVGGTVRVDTREFNFSRLATMSYSQHGYFTEDKLVFAQFDNKE